MKDIVGELVKEALAEDARERGTFDADGFSNFFPEHEPEDIRLAWKIYDSIRNGGSSLKDWDIA